MGKKNYNLARKRTRQYLEACGIKHHMFHGPTSDEYWTEPLRVLSVNLESYGYDNCGHVEVDLKCLLDWMYDRGNTGTRTVRYTFAGIQVLLNAYSKEQSPSSEDLRIAYANVNALESVAHRVAYYNIRSTSNSEKRQDYGSILASGYGELSQCIYDEMVALEAHVILISGQAGLAVFNSMWNLHPPLHFLECRWHSDATLVQSIRHPSRPNYEEYTLFIANIVSEWKSKT